METLQTLLRMNAYRIPLLLVCGVGIYLAVTRWRLHRRTALFATVGLAILLLAHLAPIVFDAKLLNASDEEVAGLARLTTPMGHVLDIAQAIGLGFLLAGVFARRGPN